MIYFFVDHRIKTRLRIKGWYYFAVSRPNSYEPMGQPRDGDETDSRYRGREGGPGDAQGFDRRGPGAPRGHRGRGGGNRGGQRGRGFNRGQPRRGGQGRY